MKAIVKIKLWPLIVVGLVWLFGTIVPFANGIVRLLYEAVTEIVGAIFPRVLTTEYTAVATLLGPLAPAAGSDAEVILRAGLIIATITGVGLLIATLASGSPSLAGCSGTRPKTLLICYSFRCRRFGITGAQGCSMHVPAFLPSRFGVARAGTSGRRRRVLIVLSC